MTEHNREKADTRAKLTIGPYSKDVWVHRWTVREGISTLFEVNVEIRSEKHDLPLNDIYGKEASFWMSGDMPPEMPDASRERVWTGVVTSATSLKTKALSPTQRATTNTESTYAIVIRPKMWSLTRAGENKIFHKKSIPDIIKKVLEKHKIDHTINATLPETSMPWEYRTQYHETDFAFVSRLMEEIGLSYAFEMKGSKLVISDKMPIPGETTVPFDERPTEHIRENAPFARDVAISHNVNQVKQYNLDYHFRFPDNMPSSYYAHKDRVAEPPLETSMLLERNTYEHGVTRNLVPEDRDNEQKKKMLVQRAAATVEAERTPEKSISLTTNHAAAGAGTKLKIQDHPRSDIEGKELIVVSNYIEGHPLQNSTNTVEAVYSGDAFPYRTPQTTPVPRIDGVQSAQVVTQDDNEEIYVDKYGRVQVMFYWDRDPDKKKASSQKRWVRVSQGWAGVDYGMMMIPRKGQEVLVAYWEGNPDQPVIIGRAYNETRIVPYPLPENKTKSTWRSQTSPKKDPPGFNEIMFEDLKDKEKIFVQAEKDMDVLVKNNRSTEIGRVSGGTDSLTVRKDYKLQVCTDRKAINPDQVAAKATAQMVWEDKKATFTTKNATIRLNDREITIEAKGDIRIESEREVIIRGSKIKLNC